MIYKVNKAYTKPEVLDLMEPLIKDWFDSRFKGLTEPQSYAVPLIHDRKNVLVSSPTGSGKTLTAFLSIINELLKLQKEGKLEDKIYCVYISPLKALANDINKNLTSPLDEMVELAKKSGYEVPAIRTAIRHGDTPSSERQRMVQKPPHIFITTPETLSIVLSTTKFRQKFVDVKYVIVDEIHEICSSKRGAHLSLSLERLQDCVKETFVRIGLSATIAPIDEVSGFLVGYGSQRSKDPRDVHVVQVEGIKRLDISVVCPVNDILSLPSEIVNSRMYSMLKDMVEGSRTTLVFTNTRSGAERVAYKLKEFGLDNIEAHHGSLSKFIRHDVEDRLRNGDLKAAISSTSLELGIDIGYIDLVCQIGSPKSIAKGLQRIGRAGHAYGDVSVGKMIVADNDDLMECAALTKNAYENRIDRVDIPRNCLDVLAQSIIGMSLEKKWGVDEAYGLVKRSYSFHGLRKKEFLEVLDYLSSREPEHRIYSKIWYDRDEKVFGRKKGSRLIYYTNVGTIPEEGKYTVISDRGATVGSLSENFVEHLSSGDVFVLGGKPYQFENARGMRVYATSAEGRRPTVPSWFGEMLPRSFDLAVAVGEFRRLIIEKLKEGKEEAKRWLIDEYRVDDGSANSILNYMEAQKAVIPSVPTDRDFLIEGYTDLRGNRNVIFHFCLGRRANDALSRAYAYAVSGELKCNVKVSVTDDNFMLTFPRHIDIEAIQPLVRSDGLEEMLRKAVRNTVLFKQRFRHCATRSFMILRNYKGHEVSLSRQQLRSSRVLDYLHRLENFPVIKETYNEIENEVMDLTNAKAVLQSIEKGNISVHTSDYSDLPSPLAHNVVLMGISDIVLMEDRSALLRELHRKVLKRIMPDVGLKSGIDPAKIERYFENKFGKVEDAKGLVDLLGLVGPMNLTQRRGTNIFRFSDMPPKSIHEIVKESATDGSIQSVHTPTGILWVAKDDLPTYSSIFAKPLTHGSTGKKVLEALGEGPKSTGELSKSLGMETKELLGILKRLERSHEVHRLPREKTDFAWGKREVHMERHSKAIRRAVLKRLELGPHSKDEIAHNMGMPPIELDKVLDSLEGSEYIVKGDLSVDMQEQYILMKDFVRLSSREETKGIVIEDDRISAFIINKQFGLKGISGYFETFMDAPIDFDVYNHVDGYDQRDWDELWKASGILQGRFVSGRVRFVRSDYADVLATTSMVEGLNSTEEEVLGQIKDSKGLALSDVARSMNEDREVIRESIRHLDSNLYVIRQHPGDRSTQNIYAAFEPKKRIKNPIRKIVLNFLRSNGPANVSGIQRYVSHFRDEVMPILEKLVSAGKVSRIFSGSGEELFMLKDELDALKGTAIPKEPQIRILSMLDPFVQPIWSQIASRYGDRWIFPVMMGRSLVGMVEMWEMSGCIEVRDIDVETDILDDVVKELDRVMGYFNQNGYEILRVTGALGKRPGELDREALRIFKTNGYTRMKEFFVKGRLTTRTFARSRMLSHAFLRQGIDRNRFSGTMEIVRAQGALRTDMATNLRTDKFLRLERLAKDRKLVKVHGIPDYLSYTTPQVAQLFKRAKAFKPTEHDKMILKMIEEEGHIERKDIIRLSPLGYGNTVQSLKRLYDNCQIAKDGANRFMPIDNLTIQRRSARKRFIKMLFDNFRIFSAENLAMYTKFEFRMAETRSILRELEDEGYLTKGYLFEGDRTLYWIVKDDLRRIGSKAFGLSFVLSPADPLWSYLQQDIRERWGLGTCFVVFQGTEMIGAFKGKVTKGELKVTRFKGDGSCWKLIREFALKNNLRFSEEFEKVDDWEVMTLYEKTKGKGLKNNERILSS
jgi:ATP-dependent Lhr-like helicase